MVGPLPRQAEDRHVHAARQAAERAPDAGEAARDRRGLEPLRPRRRRACDAPEHPAPLARARARCPTSSRTSTRPASRPRAAAATRCATSPAARCRGSTRTSCSTASGVVESAAEFFYGNPDFSDLPRKHKYTIAACADRCNAPEINCIALVGAIHDGREGFAVLVGGGLSSVPRLARDLGVFVPKEEAVEVLARSRAPGRTTSATASRASRRGSSS